MNTEDFPGGTWDKNPPANAGDMGSISDLGRSHMPQNNYSLVPELLSLFSKAQEPWSPPATSAEARMP